MTEEPDPARTAEAVVDRVLRLSAELRRSGVSVSAVETQDALRAVTAVPIDRRGALRAALASSLLKQPGARSVFDRLFEVLFPARPPGPGGASGAEAPASEDLRERLMDAIRDSDAGAMREIAEEVTEEAQVDPNARVSDEHYRYRALRDVDLEDILRRLVDESVTGEGMSALGRQLEQEDFEERVERFAEEVSEEIQRRRRQGLGLDEQLEQEHRPPPEEVDFLWAKDADIESLRTAVTPLARRLALRLSHRRRRAGQGRLDVRRTVRRSLATGGVMLDPHFRRPSIGKPELWVLCDVSGSMRAFSRFTLELVYALSTQFQRVRSFVFIDGIDEVTQELDAAGHLSEALARIDTRADVVAVDGQSWYGNVLTDFWRRYGRELTPRTTVLVSADARNNFRTSGADQLREVRGKVRRVWWLNPEPRSYWNSADSIAGAFEPYTDGMFECRNLRQLEEFVGRVM